MKFKKNFEEFLTSTRFISNSQFFNNAPKCIKVNIKGIFGRQKSEFYYDENGLLSKFIEYDTSEPASISSKTIHTNIYGNTVTYDLNTTANIHSGDFSVLHYQFEFNDNKYPIYSLESIEDKNSKIRNSISNKKTNEKKYEYDSNMNLISILEKRCNYRNNNLLTSDNVITKFEYDEMGTLLEYSSSYNSILSYIYKYNYYTDGFISGSRLINEKIFNNSNYQNYDNLGNVFEVFIDGEISSSFKYDYDIHGNIIKITKTNYPPESYRRPPYISETILFEYMY